MTCYILFTLLFSLLSAQSFAQNELETIRDLIDLYRPDSMERYKRPIKFTLQRSNQMNAYATALLGRPEVIITTRALKNLKDDEALATMCHEVGHLFGERHVWTISGLAVEGEADYFEGKCLVRFLKEVRRLSHSRAIADAIDIAHHEAVAFAEGRLTWQRAYLDFYQGIHRGYPPKECRLLTVIHGIHGWKRPKCWFNPSHLATRTESR